MPPRRSGPSPTSRICPLICGLTSALLAACAPADEVPPLKPPPDMASPTDASMLTSSGYIHPDDPPGTRRASRPHSQLIEPCSDWIPGGPLTDAYGKTTSGPTSIHLSWSIRRRAGQETVTASMLEAIFGPPHPATRSLLIGQAAPLGPHWTWNLKDDPGPTTIAEAQPDGSVAYHFAQIGRIGGGGNSAGLFVECLIEWYGTPGW